MDPTIYTKFMDRQAIYPRSLDLTSFQTSASHLRPGVFGMIKTAPGVIVPVSATPLLYEVKKSAEPSTSVVAKEILQVPAKSTDNEVQFESQVGFGQNDFSDNDISEDSLKQVPDEVLNAFQTPTLTTETVIISSKKSKESAKNKKLQKDSIAIKKNNLQSKIRFVD
jgi:hypothetical protein